jgi:hypothetical protein
MSDLASHQDGPTAALSIGLVVVIGVGAGLIAPLIAPAVINPPINSREDCERVYERPCRIRWEPTP